ncbi:MAG: DUF4184 family protein [Nitrososphaerales archaeon]
MPITPLHYCLAYFFHKISKSGLNFPALIVGSMVPDLEVPFILLATKGETNRLVLHSVLGSVTLGLLLSIFISVLLYPKFVALAFPRLRGDLRSRCSFSNSLVLSSLIGVLGHVLLDSLHHEYNPLLYPFSMESFNDFVLFGDYSLASEVIGLAFMIFGLIIILREINHGREGFWKRLLVD